MADSLQYNDKVMIYEQKKNIRRMRWLLFWVVISQNVVYLLVSAVISFMEFPPHNYVRIVIIEFFSILIPLIVYAKTGGMAVRGEPKKAIKLNGFTVWQGIFIILLGTSGQFIMITLNAPMTMLQSLIFEAPVVPTIALPKSVNEIYIGIVTIALVPAILEEFLMRGIVYNSLSDKSTKVAVIFSAIMFMVLHANAVEFLGLLFLGLMLGTVVARTRSLYAAILYHFATNAMAIGVGYLIKLVESSYAMVMMFIAAAVVFVISLFIFTMLTPNPENNKCKSPISLLFQNIFNVPVALCIIVTIAVQFLSGF